MRLTGMYRCWRNVEYFCVCLFLWWEEMLDFFLHVFCLFVCLFGAFVMKKYCFSLCGIYLPIYHLDMKQIFHKQLPKMPTTYIARLVFDLEHKTLVCMLDGRYVVVLVLVVVLLFWLRNLDHSFNQSINTFIFIILFEKEYWRDHVQTLCRTVVCWDHFLCCDNRQTS